MAEGAGAGRRRRGRRSRAGPDDGSGGPPRYQTADTPSGDDLLIGEVISKGVGQCRMGPHGDMLRYAHVSAGAVAQGNLRELSDA